MAVTLRDVARLAGVSPGAVSQVLNGKPHRISPETCEQIRQAAAQLRYVPNQNAVTLVTGQSQAMGVVIPDIRNLFFAELVSGVEAVALEAGWNIVITSSSDKSALALANFRTLAARDVGAILLVPASDADETLAMEYRQAIRDYGRPVVQVDRIIPDLGVSLTAIHQRRGAKLAMEHLLDLGHRRVACVLGPTNTCAPRLSGVQEACAQRGIALRERDLYPGAYTMESGYAVADAILEGDYTAVFCFNDMMAYGFYKRCRERGISIPHDLSVMGFDGVLFPTIWRNPSARCGSLPVSWVWRPPGRPSGNWSVRKRRGSVLCWSRSSKSGRALRRRRPEPSVRKHKRASVSGTDARFFCGHPTGLAAGWFCAFRRL